MTYILCLTTKTKVTVVGSEIDMAYIKKVKPWKMNNETVKVTEIMNTWGRWSVEVDRKRKTLTIDLKKEERIFFLS